jgi:hypothetical protein
MDIEMSSFGTSLTTRVAGRSAYKEIVSKIESSDDTVVFDFSGVDSITNSFADEVFGRLALDFGIDQLREFTTFRSIKPFWAHVVRSAMDTRDSQRDVPVAL